MKKIIYLLPIFTFIAGCAGATGNIGADDPVERGASYIACAIITHAIISLFR